MCRPDFLWGRGERGAGSWKWSFGVWERTLKPGTGSVDGRARVGDSGSEWVEAVTFYADGTADAGEIVLRDRQGFRLGLRVHGATGRVELRELERE